VAKDIQFTIGSIEMTAKQWNEVEVEVTEPDILRAVQNGKLEGVIQDVFSRRMGLFKG